MHTHTLVDLIQEKGKRLKCMCYIWDSVSEFLYWRYFLLSCMQPGSTAFSHMYMSFLDIVSSHSLAHTVIVRLLLKSWETHTLYYKNHKSYPLALSGAYTFKWILSKVRRWKIALNFENDLIKISIHHYSLCNVKKEITNTSIHIPYCIPVNWHYLQYSSDQQG